MTIEKIYFDLDDTLADFSLGLSEICGMKPIRQGLSTRQQCDAMWAAIRNAVHFYAQLKECAPGIRYFRLLREAHGGKVEILTAIPKAKRGIVNAEADKLKWCAEHIGTDVKVNIVHSAEEKKDRVTGAGCVLIDDLERNITAWREAGGTGVHFLKDDAMFTAREMKAALGIQ